MPLYELFCLAKPRLGKAVLSDIIKLAGRTVLDKGGVITDVKSFGEQKLAYEIRRPGEKYEEVSARCPFKIFQFPCACKP
jgi:small subunit ribosomal protein S6